MKLFIIGGGAVSESTHIPAAINIIGAENVLIAEPDNIQSQKIATKFGLQNFVVDYKEVLDKVDAVIIATPPHLHNAILADCIKANLPVLCEKPLSPDSKESKAVLSKNNNGLILGVCHTYRLFSNRLKVRELIKSGFFGNQINIDIQEGFPAGWPTVSGYCFRKELVPGGVLFDAGVHSLDFILWCLGEPININYEDDKMGGLESNAKINLQFQSGSADLRISRTCELSNKIIVSGNGNIIELEIYEMNKLLINGVNIIADTNRLLDWTNIGECQIKDFIDATQNKSKISCTIEEGLRVVEVIEKCYSLKQAKQVVPEPIGNYKAKKVLVTGGTGFIGSLLAERLYIHEGADVRVMVHNWPKAAYISRFDIELVKADITNYENVDKAVEGCDYVFHCIGLGGDQAMKINADGTENIVRACVKYNVKRIVYLSSVVVHGDKISDGMTAEAPFVSYGDGYADSKIEAENRYWKLTKEGKLEASVIRPTFVWGPMSEWFTVEIIKQMKNNRFYWVDNGSGSCNAVYVENVVDLALICGQHPKAIGESFLITDDEKTNWKSFYRQYAEMLNIDSDAFLSIPLKDGYYRKLLKYCQKALTNIISDLWSKVLATEQSNPFYSKWLLRAPRKVFKIILKNIQERLPEKSESEMAIYNFQGFIDITKTKQQLDYTPHYSISKGMERTKNWLADQSFLIK
ncbi:NAD-dependent epimerase/dehydratase family protein [Spirosoma fluviale]|uniref:Predicted dehydrogenase n=1 Tax=Spirosoma fluviale TaxID=1597977 RepID=A0A286FE02_9BACT|nr:NAD-dependent epimerase/dehydratase family protein [Spirosoma fluviale]SOD81219.1 Predicted dehydrogenase [Spirosoma fluviale]